MDDKNKSQEQDLLIQTKYFSCNNKYVVTIEPWF